MRTADRVLDVAVAELHGTITRTKTSVIGLRGGETLIFATSTRGWSVTLMLTSVPFAFVLEPRGLFRKTLHAEGAPLELVRRIIDEASWRALEGMKINQVRVMTNGLRIEHPYDGRTDAVATVMDLAATLAKSARAEQEARSPRRATLG